MYCFGFFVPQLEMEDGEEIGKSSSARLLYQQPLAGSDSAVNFGFAAQLRGVSYVCRDTSKSREEALCCVSRFIARIARL